MGIEQMITIGGGIILLYFVVRFFTKVLFKLIGTLLVVGGLAFILFYWNGGLLDLGNKEFMMYELQDKYCGFMSSDVKCDCIIEPIMKDLKKEHSSKELRALQKNKVKALLLIVGSANRQKSKIMRCLKERDAVEKWDEFIEDLSDFRVDKELDKAFEKLRKVIDK